MNHHRHNSIPQMGKAPTLCGHCKNKSTTGGTHNGCSNCGRVRHTKGKRIRKQQ